ncbi:AbrB family transcriptional regulator [Brevibacillus agri]|nr:AbrB family transcriptional regulator [Brevibacillus agri]
MAFSGVHWRYSKRATKATSDKKRGISMLLLRILLTLLLGSAGGWLFAEVLHSPLPWLIGSLLATVAATMLGVQKLWIPGWFRQAGLIVIGISLGLRMTPDIWQTMTDHIGLMLIATLLTVLISLLNAWIFYKMGKVDRVTAIFSNIPGGLSEMVTIGQSVGGNQQVISIFHSIRAVTIVLCTPFLISWLFDGHASSVVLSTGGHVLEWLPTILLVTASLIGALVATRCSIPAPYLLGPLLIAALVSLNTPWTGENPALAGGLVKAAQVWIGVSIGLGFRKENIRKQKRFFLLGAIHSLLLFGMVTAMAVGLAYFADMEVATSILATAPGGIAEMSLTAMSIGADPLLVTAFQLFRVLFVLTLFSFGGRSWGKRHRAEAAATLDRTA